MSKAFYSKSQHLMDESQTVDNFYESKLRSVVKKSSSSSSSTTNAMGVSQSPMDVAPPSSGMPGVPGVGGVDPFKLNPLKADNDANLDDTPKKRKRGKARN